MPPPDVDPGPRADAEAILRPAGRPRYRDLLRRKAVDTARRAAERAPRLYVGMARRQNPHRRLVDPTTDVVVEGFPRSGNTFLLSWLTLANPGLKVASHLHSFSHVRLARNRGIPAVVLIRNPVDALASELINQFGRGTPTTVDRLICRYRHFYTATIACAADLVISPFDVTTGHPELVARCVGEHLGVDLNLRPDEAEHEVTAEIEQLNSLHVGTANEMTVARPSSSRAELTNRIRDELCGRYPTELDTLGELHDTLATAGTALCRPDPDGSAPVGPGYPDQGLA